MAVSTLSWVLDHSEEAGSNRLVLIALADASNEHCAFVSVATIARRARLSERSVQYALRSLEANGAIEKVGTHATGVHMYQVVIHRGDNLSPGGAKSAPPSLDETSTGVQPVAPDPKRLTSTASYEASEVRTPNGVHTQIKHYFDEGKRLVRHLPRSDGAVLARVLAGMDPEIPPPIVSAAITRLVEKGLRPTSLPGMVPEVLATRPEVARQHACPRCRIGFKTERRLSEHLANVHDEAGDPDV